MDIIEMHKYADLLLDKANSPWYSSEEKDIFIILAQAEYVETRHLRFELDERVRKELLPLVRRSNGVTTATINLDAIQDYMFTLSLQGEFKKKCGDGDITQPISPIQLDDYAENQKDPFNKASDENPLYTEENNGTNNVALIKSDNVPSSYILMYLKRPVDVINDEADPGNNVNCELPAFTHEDIINLAVRKMMANTEQQLNYGMQSNEINKTEN
jgi:hypothetical protein